MTVYKHFGNDLFITSSAWRNNANAAVGGVGMVLDKKWTKWTKPGSMVNKLRETVTKIRRLKSY